MEQEEKEEKIGREICIPEIVTLTVIEKMELELQKKMEELESSKYNYYKILEVTTADVDFFLKKDTFFLYFFSFHRKKSNFFSLFLVKLIGKDRKYREHFFFCEKKVIDSYIQAFCVLSHPELKKIYDRFFEQGKEKKFVEYVGSQFEFFLKEEEDCRFLHLVLSDHHEKDKRQFQFLQNKVFKTVSLLKPLRLFLKEELNLIELKKRFLSHFEEELKGVLFYLSLSKQSPIYLPDEILSFFTKEEVGLVRSLFWYNLRLIFLLKRLLWEKRDDDIIGSDVFSRLRVTHFWIVYSEERRIEERFLCDFFREVKETIIWEKEREKDLDNKRIIILFTEMIDFIFSSIKEMSDFKETVFFLKEINSLSPSRWKECYIFHRKLMALINEEKDSTKLRNNYYKFLFLDIIPNIIFFPEPFYNQGEKKELLERQKKVKEILINDKNYGEIAWRGCTFPVQEALDCLEEACCVYNNPILERIYDSFLKKGKGELFVKLVGLFSKKIEDKISEDKKPFFISDQSQEWLSEKILEVAEELYKNSSLENNDIKEILILSYEAEVEILNEILKNEFFSPFDPDYGERSEKEKATALILKKIYSYTSIFTVEAMFRKHLKTIFDSEIFNWKEDKKNISGKKEFIEFLSFREEVLEEPLNFLYQFGERYKKEDEKKIVITDYSHLFTIKDKEQLESKSIIESKSINKEQLESKSINDLYEEQFESHSADNSFFQKVVMIGVIVFLLSLGGFFFVKKFQEKSFRNLLIMDK